MKTNTKQLEAKMTNAIETENRVNALVARMIKADRWTEADRKQFAGMVQRRALI